jgi:NitT/TauT family transport system ATP-binding protein
MKPTAMVDLTVVPSPKPKVAPPCIKIDRVSKGYLSRRGDVIALEGISLDIAEGEFLSIVGPSGCGKSTLLRCIAGLASVTTGTISIRGQTVTGPNRDMGVVFQRDLLLDWRTVFNNIMLAVEFRDGRSAAVEQRAKELLELVGLGGYADRYPWELSGGMRQRAAICRALLSDPSILLMDEPFGALDAMTRDSLNIELQRIWMKTRKTVVFVTHSIGEAVFLSDRILVMSPRPGRILELIEVKSIRPRSFDARDTVEFGRHSAHIRSLFASMGEH